MSAALFASLFALLVTAHAQNICTSKFYGSTHRNNKDLIQVSLPDYQIRRNVMKSDVEVPKQVFKRFVCLTGKHVGTRITACDYDVVPVLHIKGLNNAVVIRKSDANRVCTVFTTVYCKMEPDLGDTKEHMAPLFYKIS